ncbi:MAG: DUF924 family protein [Geminicoccaceae bacterium]
MSDLDPEAERLLAFWFEPDHRTCWFESTAAFDEACRELAVPLFDAALSGEFDGWAGTARGALALVILLDQMPRNVFRGTARAFAYDEKARAVSSAAVTAGMDRQLSPEEKIFLYLPFEHSEDLDDQRRSVELFTALGDAEALKYAVVHLEIIERFGRFPHRNAALGRTSTPQERDYLAGSGAAFEASQQPPDDSESD